MKPVTLPISPSRNASELGRQFNLKTASQPLIHSLIAGPDARSKPPSCASRVSRPERDVFHNSAPGRSRRLAFSQRRCHCEMVGAKPSCDGAFASAGHERDVEQCLTLFFG